MHFAPYGPKQAFFRSLFKPLRDPSRSQLERQSPPLFQNGLCFPCVLGTRQELRHVLVLGSVVRPPFSGRVPAIVASRHIDTMVNQELCCFILPSDGAFVKDASR